MATVNFKNNEEKARVLARVNALKPKSSAYNYYLGTPLSELKTREEKLIKKELEMRELNILSEEGVLVDTDPKKSTKELLSDKAPQIAKTAAGTAAVAGAAWMTHLAALEAETQDILNAERDPTRQGNIVIGWLQDFKDLMSSWGDAISENAAAAGDWVSDKIDTINTNARTIANSATDSTSKLGAVGSDGSINMAAGTNSADAVTTFTAQAWNYIGDKFSQASDAIQKAWQYTDAKFITPYITKANNQINMNNFYSFVLFFDI